MPETKDNIFLSKTVTLVKEEGAVKKINRESIILAYMHEAEVVKIITLYYTTKLDRVIQSKTVRGAWKKVR